MFWIFQVIKCIKDRRRQRRYRLPTSSLNKIPTKKYQKGDPYETCAICLEDFIEGEKLRVLPCNHGKILILNSFKYIIYVDSSTEMNCLRRVFKHFDYFCIA